MLDNTQDAAQQANTGGTSQPEQMTTEQMAMQQAQANLSRRPGMLALYIKYIIAVAVLVGWVYIHYIARIV